MTAKLLQACVYFQPAELACWEVLLRDSLAADHLPTADTARAMNRIVRAVWDGAAAGGAEKAGLGRGSAPSEFAAAECGREKLEAFLVSGSRALNLIFAEIVLAHPECPPAAELQVRRRMEAAFTAVARAELDALCRECPMSRDCARRKKHPTFGRGPDGVSIPA